MSEREGRAGLTDKLDADVRAALGRIARVPQLLVACDYDGTLAPLVGDPTRVEPQDLNSFLHGWTGYFRYGNSARDFDKIRHHALNRSALFVAARHERPPAWGWWLVVYRSTDQLGLLNPNGSTVSPRPIWGWRERPNAAGEGRR